MQETGKPQEKQAYTPPKLEKHENYRFTTGVSLPFGTVKNEIDGVQ